MLTFKSFIKEGYIGYPPWVKVTAAVIVMKVKTLSTKIESETDPIKQNSLISQQNKLLSYLSGLGIAVGTKDKTLMGRLRSIGR